MKRNISVFLLLIALIVGINSSAFAVSSYLNQFNTRYGTASTALNTCSICHVPAGPPSRNTYGAAWRTANRDFAAIEAMDSDGDGFSNITEINARTFPGDAASKPAAGDTAVPVVSAFTIPATSSSLTVAISSLTATDAVGVTGYLVNESSTAPAASAAGWSATAPASYNFATAGAKTLFAWAKDAAGNVSAGKSATVAITIVQADTTPPTVNAFTIPTASGSLTVAITSFTASDNVGVTGYMVTESSTAPAASASGWSATAPASYSFTTAGAKTLFAWAKDAAGNVSAGKSATVTITIVQADTTPPTVNAFTIPADSSSLTVAISSLTATDNAGVTGYKVTESAATPTASASGWSATTPASYTFATAGAKTLFAWAKDAAGNVSAGKSATVTITISGGTTAPDLSIWVGKWFKLTKKNMGYHVVNSKMKSDTGTVTEYLKIWAWDPVNKVLEGDLYGHAATSNDTDDADDNEDSGRENDNVQWLTEPLTLNYLAGKELDFLGWSQVTGDVTAGFAARIRGWKEGDALEMAVLKTLGGYYQEVTTDTSGAVAASAGGLSLQGKLIQESQVPVPADIIVVH